MPNALIVALLMASQASPDCDFAHSVYSDRNGRGYTMEPSGSGGDLAISLKSTQTGITYRFQLSTGNGYASTSLNPVPEPARGFGARPYIYAFRDDFSSLGDFPRGDSVPPAYLLAPELGRTLWYQAEQLGGPTLASGIREQLSVTFFAFAGCRQ